MNNLQAQQPFVYNQYKILSHLPKNKWRKALNSKNSIFKVQVSEVPKYLIGPSIADDGQVLGDMLMMEQSLFFNVSNTQQQEFYQILSKENVIAAKEYLLQVINAKKLWKDDIKAIRTMIHYLEAKEHLLENEEKIKNEDEESNLIIKTNEFLERKNTFLNKLNLEQFSIHSTISELKKNVALIDREVKYLKSYLKKTEKELPFLFED
ncbi:MAG: hypothetical protein ABIC91_05755 [Nanoarchaeota archaeon]|nr:hypothetical protein [Nanoarchaeota archaeon]MBU1030806.1 hypothetical protein [Nanoarchaeota archaeon]